MRLHLPSDRAIAHHAFVLIFLGMICPIVTAQQTAKYTDAQHELHNGHRYFDAGLYAQAFEAYGQVLAQTSPVHEPEFIQLRRDAEYGKARAALHNGHPEGELLMLDFVRTHRPDPASNAAIVELADFYFDAEEYEKSIIYFSMLHSRELQADVLSEVRFKQGYAHFARKEFSSAEAAFGEVRELKTVYYYPVNYYFGMCRFFRDDHDGALASFEKVAQSEKYRDYVPYYITQIYFVRREYEKVISYAEPRLQHSGLKNREEIRGLVGRAHFELGNYAVALPHLEAYAKHSGAMRAEDFYQLAFAQYTSGDYPAAITNFRNIASQENLLGQRANFYLAHCYLKTGDLNSARTGFRNVSRMNYDTSLRDEALLHYGKISADLHYDAEAIQSLNSIPAGSVWYSKAQESMRQVILNTRDYATALQTLDGIDNLTPTLKEAYQQVSLYYGMQLMQDLKMPAADKAFAGVQKYPVNNILSAQAMFWRAEIAHQNRDYASSADLLRQYFTLSKSTGALPLESSTGLAYYTQGYNYLRQNNYSVAQTNFQEAIALLKKPPMNQYHATALPDAMVRAGDCAFKRNLYNEARKWYDEAIPLGGSYMVYAKFQRAMIEGLERRPEAKVRQLEQMKTDHPDSDLADDVLMQLGITYQETGKNDKAVPAFERLLEKYPNSALYVPALLRLGLISYNTGDISGALSYYKRVFKHQPGANEGREALSALEEIYVRDLKTPDAYFEFVASVPGYEISAMKKDSVSYRVAEIQYEQAEYPAAVKAFTEYLQRYPNGVNVTSAYFYRGDAHGILKQYSDALRDFEQVVRRGQSPYYVDALQRAAILSYNHTMDFKEAFRYYNTLRETLVDAEKQFEAELGLLRSAYRAEYITETMKLAERVTTHPSSTDAIKAEAYYYGAKMAYVSKEYEKALDGYNQAEKFAQNEQAAESRYRIAEIYYLRGHADLAEQFCHRANERNANYPYWVARSLILLSDIALSKNDLFNAKAPLEAVIENFRGDLSIVEEAQEKLNKIRLLEQQQTRILQDTGKSMQFQIEEDYKNE